MTPPEPASQAPGRGCPSCGDAMQRGSFEHRAGGALELEWCVPCRALWFDAYESAQLAPRGIIDVFRIVNEASRAPERPVGPELRCPACHDRLVLTHDLQRTTRFTYYRCPAGDGRFTPFVQFLREKEFVRSLSPAEIERLRVTVKQVRCSACGAAIDLADDAACPYCGSPIAILDAGAVEQTLARLEEQARTPRPRPDARALIEALAASERRPSPAFHAGSGFALADSSAGAVLDLVAGALDFFLPGDGS